MNPKTRKGKVQGIEIIEKKVLGADGFLRLEKMIIANRNEDGSLSRRYKIDVVHRKGADSVAIIPYYFDGLGQLQVYLKRGIRAPIYFRKELNLPLPDPRDNLYAYEAVAGSLEEKDQGDEAVILRAQEELLEELGFLVELEEIHALGGGFFPSQGMSSEKIHLVSVQVSPEKKTLKETVP
jgi:8-oxo-dGTP pyrophosphatase MutT (NUDIX family)